MTRSCTVALIATALLVVPARRASAQSVGQDVKTGAHAVGGEASKIGKGTAKVAVKAADATADEGKKVGKGTAKVAVKAANATAGEGKKVGTYVKHRVSKPHRTTTTKRRTTTADTTAH